MPQRSKLSTECLQHEIFRELSKHKAAEVGNPTVLEQARLKSPGKVWIYRDSCMVKLLWLDSTTESTSTWRWGSMDPHVRQTQTQSCQAHEPCGEAWRSHLIRDSPSHEAKLEHEVPKHVDR